MGRFNENDLPKAKVNASSLKKTLLIFQYANNHRWKFYVGLLFLLLTSVTALAFPKFIVSKIKMPVKPILLREV